MSVTQSPGLFSNKQTGTDGTSLFILWGEKKKGPAPATLSLSLPSRTKCSLQPLPHTKSGWQNNRKALCGSGRQRSRAPEGSHPVTGPPWRNTACGPTSRIVCAISSLAGPALESRSQKKKNLPTSAPHHFLYKRKEERREISNHGKLGECLA